ncbi:MAG: hypothetical protein ACREJ4_08600, partial [Candidatus Methylomirabilaceae bacterium]
MIGLLGALSTLPVSIGIVYTTLALAVPRYLSAGGIETRGTHLFYTATARAAALLPPGERLYLILTVLTLGFQGLLLWLIWRDFHRSGENKQGFPSQMLKGLGIVLVLLLLYRVMVFPLRMSYAVAGGVWHLFTIKEPQWLTWLLMSGALAALLAP